MNKRLLYLALASLALAGGVTAQSTTPSKTPTTKTAQMAKVNVNTATVAQLETLPGIGPKTAAQIVKGRPYKNAADFRAKVKRIGNAEWGKIQSLVSF